ncbi:signal transduction histidine kinase [Nocardia sp. GAS34]|uniref:sensor histidine kinase n=1 Tax=unclassified Nocardia TaxID=2637762 RepID=UPI003D1EEB80
MRTTAASALSRQLAARSGAGVQAIGALASGLGTALFALLTVLGWLGAGALRLAGVRALGPMRRVTRAVARCERDRLERLGHEIGPLLEPGSRRVFAWLVCHATLGLLLGLLGIVLPLVAVRELSYPLWWRVVPAGQTGTAWGTRLNTWPGVLADAGLGLGWLLLLLAAGPLLARIQMGPALRLLTPPADGDLSQRVAELTATRAGALQAHAAELRRIERALHDGTQNRLAGTVVLLGAARRAVARDPEKADALLERAQQAAEAALAELRTVVRTVLPPVVADHGLDAALATLAANCPIECRLQGESGGRLALSLEATAYFVVSEALTNAVRHSRAHRITVEVGRAGGRLGVRVSDDGHGGADEAAGTGLAGIRQRVAAHDGTLKVSSPRGGPTTVEVWVPCVS